MLVLERERQCHGAFFAGRVLSCKVAVTFCDRPPPSQAPVSPMSRSVHANRCAPFDRFHDLMEFWGPHTGSSAAGVRASAPPSGVPSSPHGGSDRKLGPRRPRGDAAREGKLKRGLWKKRDGAAAIVTGTVSLALSQTCNPSLMQGI